MHQRRQDEVNSAVTTDQTNGIELHELDPVSFWLSDHVRLSPALRGALKHLPLTVDDH